MPCSWFALCAVFAEGGLLSARARPGPASWATGSWATPRTTAGFGATPAVAIPAVSRAGWCPLTWTTSRFRRTGCAVCRRLAGGRLSRRGPALSRRGHPAAGQVDPAQIVDLLHPDQQFIAYLHDIFDPVDPAVR